MNTQELQHVRLSDEQAKVLLKVLTAPTPVAAFSEMNDGAKAIESSKLLVDLRLVDVDRSEQTASVNDAGLTTLRNEGLIDDSNEPTDRANSLIGDNQPGGTNQAPPPQQDEPGFDDSTEDGLPKMESLSLIREINDKVNLNG